MSEIIYRNRMQSFALALVLMLSVILAMIPLVSAENHDVSITDDMKFDPEDLAINVGDTVTWTNNDGMGHTATSTDGPASFDSGNIAAGATWSFTFTEAGTYNYKCNYHSSMTAAITVVESDDGDEEEDEPPRDDSDWFTWTMNGTHHSILAVTNESLNWTHLIVSIYNDTGVYKQPSWYNAVEYESDLEMNHTWLENGTHFANITLYHNEDILAYHNWTFLIEESSENEEEETEETGNNETEDSSDSDNDGILDDDDTCPDEDASGHDADADGCIDDTDNDGVKDNLDICPFDATDGCPAALENQQTEGECTEGDVKNEDCNSCHCEIDPEGNESWVCTEMDCGGMKEETPGFGIFTAIISCLVIVLRKRN